MHSIVTTFRGAVIKVEVANFCAAMDTLIDQDGTSRVLKRYNHIRKKEMWGESNEMQGKESSHTFSAKIHMIWRCLQNTYHTGQVYED